jgi:hypothetical protein
VCLFLLAHREQLFKYRHKHQQISQQTKLDTIYQKHNSDGKTEAQTDIASSSALGEHTDQGSTYNRRAISFFRISKLKKSRDHYALFVCCSQAAMSSSSIVCSGYTDVVFTVFSSSRFLLTSIVILFVFLFLYFCELRHSVFVSLRANVTSRCR